MPCSTPRRPAARRPAFASALSPLALGALLALSAAPRAAHAVTYIWTGAGGGSGAGSTWLLSPDNWQGNSAPPLTGGLGSTDLVFAAGSYTTLQLALPLEIHSLTFRAGASAYSFEFNVNGLPAGSALFTVGAGGMAQNAASPQIFRDAVNLGDNQTWTLANGSGALNFLGGVQTHGMALTISAATMYGGLTNVVNGVISGSGSLTKTSDGILTLGSASTYSGNTTVEAGVLAIGSGAGITGGNLTVNGGWLAVSGTGTVSPSGTLTVDSSEVSNPARVSLKDSASLSTGGVAYIGYLGTGTFN